MAAMLERRRALLGAAGLALGWGVNAQEQPVSQLTESSFESSAGPVAFQLYLPAGYPATAQRRYPLLLLLHGRGDKMSAWTRVRPLLDQLIASRQIPPLIAVMPDAPWSRRGSYYIDSAHINGAQVETALVRELLPHLTATYRLSADGGAHIVGGYSMGGYGALRYALAFPRCFGAALVLSPAVYTPLPPQGSSAREFGGFGSGPALFDDDIYRLHNYPALLPDLIAQGQRLRIFIAAGDQEYKNPEPLDAMHDIDMEAHLLFNSLARLPNAETALRILDGGHDWPVWLPAFHEGLLWATRRLRW